MSPFDQLPPEWREIIEEMMGVATPFDQLPPEWREIIEQFALSLYAYDEESETSIQTHNQARDALAAMILPLLEDQARLDWLVLEDLPDDLTARWLREYPASKQQARCDAQPEPYANCTLPEAIILWWENEVRPTWASREEERSFYVERVAQLSRDIAPKGKSNA